MPTFRFERDGTFILIAQARRPGPEDIFSCKALEDIQNPSLPRRESAEMFSVVWDERSFPMILVTSAEKHIPLFWRAELFDQQGRPCSESVYADFWRLKRSDELTYLSFNEKARPLELRAEGRLIEVMLYVTCFEQDERAGERIFRRLQEQAIQKAVSENWQELTSTILVNLSTESLLRKRLADKYTAVAETMKLLMPKNKGVFAKLFGQ